MIWYSLLIPVILTLIAYSIWKHKFTIGELFVPLIVTFFTILISYFMLKHVNMQDVEYNGYIVKEAKYYEYWETWVKKECSYTTCNGHDKNGNCTGYTTHYYDCSYCDENPEHYLMYDSGNNSYSISKEKYNELITKWKATPIFRDQDRNIKYHGSCGKDGDAYSIYWNNDPITSEATVREVSFENIVKISHSAFNYPDITDNEAIQLSLYAYPKLNGWRQSAILGLDSLNISAWDKERIQRKFEYLNGDLGPLNKVKVFTLLFKNKPIDIAYTQEAYWDGGNQNELVVCIGIDDSLNITWVKPFSWCDNKRIIVDTREDVANLKSFKEDEILSIYTNNINNFFKYKSFKDFNYLTFEPTVNQIVLVYFIALLITCLSIWFCVKNELEN